MSANTSAADTELKSYTFQPSAPLRGTAILIHGHGDYSSRYETILEPFLQEGICCLSTDLPGHGLSPGRRGFIQSLQAVDDIIRDNYARARSICPDGPIGLIGHSVGGLLALRELRHRHENYHFTWISSPLLRPDATRHPLVVTLLRILGALFPSIPLDTTVKPADCRHLEIAEGECAAVDDQYHTQISLGWGRTLLHIAEEIAEGFPEPAPDLPILFTQGTADPVCNPIFLRDFLEANDFPRATHLEFEDQLHEPFADTAQDEVLTAIADWLKKSLPEPEAQESSPSG